MQTIYNKVKRKSYGEVCTTGNTDVDTTVSLTCGPNNYAICSGSLFWNSSYCGKFLNAHKFSKFYLNWNLNRFLVSPISVGLSCDNDFKCDTTKCIFISFQFLESLRFKKIAF